MGMIVTASGLAEIVDAAGYAENGAIAVAVVNGDGTVVTQERGSRRDGLPMTCDTRVYGASLTKQIVAMCAARLAKSGQIDPESSIAPWFPEFPDWVQEVRVQHLLHHTSGLPDEATLFARMNELGLTHRTSETMISGVKTFPTLARNPGRAWVYSNIGYVMLGRIVEIVSGTSLRQLLDDLVYQPLGMTQSGLWDGPDANPDGANPLDPDYPIPHSLGDGGMWTTANDLTRWIKASNRDAFNVQDLVMTRGSLNYGTVLDYAWGINVTESHGVTTCAHGGGWPGSISQMVWIPARASGFIAFTVDGGEPLKQVTAALVAELTKH